MSRYKHPDDRYNWFDEQARIENQIKKIEMASNKKTYVNEVAKTWGCISGIGFGLLFVIYLMFVVATLEMVKSFNDIWGFIVDDGAAAFRVIFFLAYVVGAIIAVVNTHNFNKSGRSSW